AYILTKEEGGRHTPFFNNYRPQFYFRTTDVTGQCTLPAGTEMIMPGDNATMDVELITPIAMEEKQRFAIREGGKTVGAGVVVSITECQTADDRSRRCRPSSVGCPPPSDLQWRMCSCIYNPRGGPRGRRKRFRRSVAQWPEHRSPKPSEAVPLCFV